MYVYIDESGDTGYTNKSTRYFILTAVIVEDPFVLRRIAKNVHQYNLSKKKMCVLHSNKEGQNVKNKLTKNILKSEIKCVTYIFDKDTFKAKDVYIHSLKEFAEYFYMNGISYVVIARKDIRKFYNSKILDMYSQYGLRAILSDPAREKSLQIADFYSWCIFSYYEHGTSEYFLKLKNLITIIKTKPSTGL